MKFPVLFAGVPLGAFRCIGSRSLDRLVLPQGLPLAWHEFPPRVELPRRRFPFLFSGLPLGGEVHWMWFPQRRLLFGPPLGYHELPPRVELAR